MNSIIYRHGNREVPQRRDPKKRICYHCDGSGRNPKDPEKICYVCQGKGEI
jgi:DnaJ-class molecular chaperone